MKLDEFLQKDITPQRLPSVWINNQKFVFQADDGGLAVFDTATNSVATLVTNHTMVRHDRGSWRDLLTRLRILCAKTSFSPFPTETN